MKDLLAWLLLEWPVTRGTGKVKEGNIFLDNTRGRHAQLAAFSFLVMLVGGLNSCWCGLRPASCSDAWEAKHPRSTTHRFPAQEHLRTGHCPVVPLGVVQWGPERVVAQPLQTRPIDGRPAAVGSVSTPCECCLME